MTREGCGHDRARHCGCVPCQTECLDRQVEDSKPFVWPTPRRADGTTTRT